MKRVSALTVDIDDASGDVSLPDWFIAKDALWRADVLQCWIGQMNTIYDEAMKEFRAAIAAE